MILQPFAGTQTGQTYGTQTGQAAYPGLASWANATPFTATSPIGNQSFSNQAYGGQTLGVGDQVSQTLGVGDYGQTYGSAAGMAGQTQFAGLGQYATTSPLSTWSNVSPPVTTTPIGVGQNLGQTTAFGFQQAYQQPITSAWQLQQQIQKFQSDLSSVQAMVSQLAQVEQSNVGQLQQLSHAERNSALKLNQLSQIMNALSQNIQQVSAFAQQVSGQYSTKPQFYPQF